MRVLPPVFLLFSACDGGGDDEATVPIEEYACLHVAEGDVVDVAASRADANEITPGRDPYRVNLLPGAAGYLKFEADGPLVLLVDFAGAVPAVWTGEDRVPLDPGDADPYCDADIPEVQTIDVGAGEHVLEVGPIYQANVWMMLGN